MWRRNSSLGNPSRSSASLLTPLRWWSQCQTPFEVSSQLQSGIYWHINLEASTSDRMVENIGMDQLGLNVYPLLYPALQPAYTKIAGKLISQAQFSSTMLWFSTSNGWQTWLMPQMASILLQVSALHYLAGSWVLEGIRTVASACALHQPTIVGPSISIVSVHKFGT